MCHFWCQPYTFTVLIIEMPIFVQVSFGFSDLTHVVCLLTVNEKAFLSLPQMRIIHQPVVFWGLVCSRWSNMRLHCSLLLLETELCCYRLPPLSLCWSWWLSEERGPVIALDGCAFKRPRYAALILPSTTVKLLSWDLEVEEDLLDLHV